MSQHLSVGSTAKYLGVCVKTIHRWEISKYLLPQFRTQGGHRRYALSDLTKLTKTENPDKTIAYARVSSKDQEKDLETQATKLQNYCISKKYNFQLIQYLGSGLNYKKKGLKQLLQLINTKQINRLIINHKDRLLRFGSQLIFDQCKFNGIEVVILEQSVKKKLQWNWSKTYWK